jgi:hypothetical protein
MTGRSNWFRLLLAGAAVALLAGPVAADQPEPVEEAEVAEQEVDRADPVAKILPSVANEIAKANAFGQMGERMRAAHQAARAAAAQEAARAAGDAAAAAATERRAIGSDAAALRGDNAQRGLARAAAASDRVPDFVPRP